MAASTPVGAAGAGSCRTSICLCAGTAPPAKATAMTESPDNSTRGSSTSRSKRFLGLVGGFNVGQKLRRFCRKFSHLLSIIVYQMDKFGWPSTRQKSASQIAATAGSENGRPPG